MAALLEDLLRKDGPFIWTQVWQDAFDTLKEKLASTPILVFLDYKIPFHVHVDVSRTTIGVVLAQLDEGKIDHPIYFTNRKLSQSECNYITTEHKALVMV